jgi:hypothetical protein
VRVADVRDQVVAATEVAKLKIFELETELRHQIAYGREESERLAEDHRSALVAEAERLTTEHERAMTGLRAELNSVRTELASITGALAFDSCTPL